MLDQPDLERMLRTTVTASDAVTLRGNAKVTGISQNEAGVRVEVTDRATGERETIHAEYVLGCDGGSTVTRTSIGAWMTDLGFAQRWLVVDIATTGDIGEWEGVHQVCDPVAGRDLHAHRQEPLPLRIPVAAGGTGEDFHDRDRLHRLISPWTKDIPGRQGHDRRRPDR